MPSIDSTISKSIFYSALIGEFLRIPSSSLLHKDFNEKAMELLNRMKAQGHNSSGVEKHEKALADFGRNCNEILSKLHI